MWFNFIDHSPKEEQDKVVKFEFHGQPAQLRHRSVVITAITNSTNASSPSLMLGVGLVAKKACEWRLEVSMFVVTLFTFDHNASSYEVFLQY